MKKIVVSITLLVYLAFSSGVIISFHYCMGRLDSVKLVGTKTDLCGTCGMHLGKSHKCCGDEAKLVKLQDDQQIAQAFHLPGAPDAVAIVPSDFIVSSFYNIEVSRHYHNHSPPLLTEQDTYLQNCVFRI